VNGPFGRSNRNREEKKSFGFFFFWGLFFFFSLTLSSLVDTYRKAGGSRWYRRRWGTWQWLGMDGNWQALKGHTELMQADGKLYLLRVQDRHTWRVEVEKVVNK